MVENGTFATVWLASQPEQFSFPFLHNNSGGNSPSKSHLTAMYLNQYRTPDRPIPQHRYRIARMNTHLTNTLPHPLASLNIDHLCFLILVNLIQSCWHALLIRLIDTFDGAKPRFLNRR